MEKRKEKKGSIIVEWQTRYEDEETVEVTRRVKGEVEMPLWEDGIETKRKC